MPLALKNLNDGRAVVYGRRTNGTYALGPILNWKNYALGLRNKPMHWIRQGEQYHHAVMRVQLEREEALEKANATAEAQRRTWTPIRGLQLKKNSDQLLLQPSSGMGVVQQRHLK